MLGLVDCLKIATRLNRDYQSQKETVYLAALALTAARYEFDPQWDAGGESTWNRTRVNIQDVDSSASLGVSPLDADISWALWKGDLGADRELHGRAAPRRVFRECGSFGDR